MWWLLFSMKTGNGNELAQCKGWLMPAFISQLVTSVWNPYRNFNMLIENMSKQLLILSIWAIKKCGS